MGRSVLRPYFLCAKSFAEISEAMHRHSD